MSSKQVTLYAPIVHAAPSDREITLQKQLDRKFEPRLEKQVEEKMHQRELSDAQHRTGIFFPDSYVPGPKLDLIVYFHGLLDRCDGSGSDTVKEYWTNKHFRLRELVNDAKKNVVLVVPRLGAMDKTGSKLGMEGDDFLTKVAAAVADRVKTDPFNWNGSMTIRNIILAAHSGGGWTMLRLAQKVTVGRCSNAGVSTRCISCLRNGSTGRPLEGSTSSSGRARAASTPITTAITWTR